MIFNNQQSAMKRGFTIIELLIALAIIGLIIGFSYAAFVSLNKSQVLEKDASALQALVKEAQSNTSSSIGSSRYGVYFDVPNNEAILFKGENFDPDNPVNKEKELILDDKVYISEVSLDQEREFIVFERPKGDTFDFGFVILSLTDDSESMRVIIYPTGSVETSPLN